MAKPGRKTTKAAPEWALRIKDARERAEMSQEGLGQKIGKSQQTVAGYEGGNARPNFTIYKRISTVTGANLARLVFGDEYSSESMADIALAADKKHRLFSWAFQQATRFVAEEGVYVDFAWVLSYTWKLLRVPNEDTDVSQAKEAILGAIEIDRVEYRKGIDESRKNLL